MLKKTVYLLFVSLSISCAFGQLAATKNYVHDFEVFKTVLEEAHPSLYMYISKAEWRKLVLQATQKVKQVENDIEFMQLLSSLAYRIGDTHISLSLKTELENGTGRFVTPVQVVDGQIITTANYQKLVQGSIIRKINNIPISELMYRLSKYSFTDAINVKNENQLIAKNFERYLYYELGPQDSFEVEYTDYGNTGTYTLTVDGSSEEFMFDRQQQAYDKLDFEMDEIIDIGNYPLDIVPRLTIDDDNTVAILTIPNFAINQRVFHILLYRYFAKLKQNAVQNLIIDVRDNQGGYIANAITLNAYLTGERNENWWDSCYTRTLRLPLVNYAVDGNVTNQYLASFGHKRVVDDKYMKYQSKATNTSQPDIPIFIYRGNTFVLFDRYSFSAASEFAKFATENEDIKTFGNESGANAQAQTAGFFADYVLPHSGIQLRFGLITFITPYSSSYASQRGIIPDQVIEPTLEDIYYGTDIQMKTLQELIYHQYTNHFDD